MSTTLSSAFARFSFFVFAAFCCASPVRAATPETNRYTPEMAEFVKRFKGGGMLNDGSTRPTPAESLAACKVADGLRWDLAAAEPLVRQPLNLHFDERGRCWVVQYLQYP